LFRLYVRAARTPGAILPLVTSFVGGGLPIGMLTLAVLLLIRLQNGSFLGAGLMAAALSVGNAVGVAVQGALIDRRGQTVVLGPRASSRPSPGQPSSVFAWHLPAGASPP
jgi:MFS family permease